MQSSVINAPAVRLGSGVLKVNDVDIGAVDAASVEATFKIAQLKFKNAKLPPRKKLDEVMLKADIVELDLVKLNSIFGGEIATILAVDNTETGNDRKVITFSDVIKLMDLYPVEFLNTDENGKVFGIRILEGYTSSSMAFDFGDDEDLESFSKIPVEFKGFPDSSNNVFEIIDEQAITV